MLDKRLCALKSQRLTESDPAALMHTSQRNLLASTGLGLLCTLAMIFVLPTIMCRPFASKFDIPTRNFPNNLPCVSTVITRSFA